LSLTTKEKRIGYYRAILSLLCNALRFRYHKLTGNPIKPVVITLALTNRCNSHCIMCNIWKRARELTDIQSLELSHKVILDLLANPLFSELVELDITGGEPNLRDDLANIIIDIGHLKKTNLVRLKSIIIASNGLLPEKIISNYREIASALKETGIDLVCVISLDGIGQVHDRIRGTSGAYEQAFKTITGLLELREKYSNLIVGIKTTILPYNLDMLDSVLDFASSKGLFHIISPVLFTEARFMNMEKSQDLKLTVDQYQKLLSFYTHSKLPINYFYSREIGSLAKGRKNWLCAASFNYLFIDYDGKIYPCEMISEPIGDLRKQSVEDIWKSHQMRHWRKRTEELECCHTCNEPGAIRYSAVTEGFSYMKFLMQSGHIHYRETLHQEGYSKYLS
jgi:MoaA/NifB/PqqE/SkfB family radical SAM enzyme